MRKAAQKELSKVLKCHPGLQVINQLGKRGKGRWPQELVKKSSGQKEREASRPEARGPEMKWAGRLGRGAGPVRASRTRN